jgi:alkaline phosphatase D
MSGGKDTPDAADLADQHPTPALHRLLPADDIGGMGEAGATGRGADTRTVEAPSTSRRDLLRTGAGGLAMGTLLGGAGTAGADPPARGRDPSRESAPDLDYPTALELPFAHGVASGDPLADRVVLWTRLTYRDPPPGQVPVSYAVATSPGMGDVVQEGTVTTGPDRDWTVKVDPAGLEPATTYYYRFSTPRGANGPGRASAGDPAESIVGRTRTAPAGRVDQLRFGVVSCTSYWSGYFNAYGRLADRDDLDLIVHCGDYVYDFPDPQEFVRARRGKFDPEYVDFRDWRTLDETRRRYALYRSDPDMVRAHQQHPWAVVWDNHDIDIDGDDITMAEVRQAFWEWTPTRPPRPDGSGEPSLQTGQVDPIDSRYLYRHLPYGDLADVFAIDAQRWRDPEASGETIYDPDRSLLGAEQFEWLTGAMTRSRIDGTDWRFVVNQKFMAPMRFTNPPRTVPLPYETVTAGNTVFNPSQWDGYPAERRRLFEHLRAYDVTDNIVVTGDMHMNWCSDLVEDPSPPAYEPATGDGLKGSVGVEFAPSSVSRGGADETLQGIIAAESGRDQEDPAVQAAAVTGSRALERGLDAANESVQYIEWVEHGYGVVDLTPDRAALEFWWTPIHERAGAQRLGAGMLVPRTNPAMENHAVRNPNPTPTSGEDRAPAPDPFA